MAELIAEQKRLGQRDKEGQIVDDPYQQTWLPGIPLNLKRGKRDRGPTLWEQT